MRTMRLWRMRHELETNPRWTIDILVTMIVAADLASMYRLARSTGIIG